MDFFFVENVDLDTYKMFKKILNSGMSYLDWLFL